MACAEVDIPGVKVVLITEEYYDQALKFAEDYFVKNEPLNKGLGMQWTNELKAFWMNSLSQNLSIMFINEDNGDTMAFRTTRIARYDDKLDLDQIQDQNLKDLVHYCTDSDQRADFFGHFRTEEAFHFFGLCVSDKYKQRGLGTQIFKIAVDMICKFGIDPVYIKVEGSSNYSKIIFEKAGFETLYDSSYEDWKVDGRVPIRNTGAHKSMKMYGLKMTQTSQ